MSSRKKYEHIYEWRKSSTPAPFTDLLRDIFSAIGDSEGLLRMEDSDPSAAELCDKLHRMINVEGKNPNCKEARRLRESRPDIFFQLKSQPKKNLGPELRRRYEILRLNQGLTVDSYARLWECTRATAMQSISTMHKAGLIRKIKQRTQRRDVVNYYPATV